MKILYLADARIPTEKAHGLAIIKMAEGLTKAGVKLTLVLPIRYAGKESQINGDPFSYYQIGEKFKIKKLFCFDIQFFHQIGLGKLAYLIRMPIYLLELIFLTILNQDKIIYTRSKLIAKVVSKFHKNVFVELHQLADKSWSQTIKKVKGIITINSQSKEDFIKKFNLKEEKIRVAPSAVSITDFANLPNQEEMKKKHNLPFDKVIVSYVGKSKIFNQEKSLTDFIVAFKQAHDLNSNLFLMIAGIKEEDIKRINFVLAKNSLDKDALVLPHIKFSKVKEYYSAADIFVLPYSSEVLSQYSLSPMKLFDYAASQRPIIAPDVSSIKEVFNQEEIEFFKTDDYQDLTNQISRLVSDSNRQNQLAQNAFSKVKNYTWEKRAIKIMDFINQKI